MPRRSCSRSRRACAVPPPSLRAASRSCIEILRDGGGPCYHCTHRGALAPAPRCAPSWRRGVMGPLREAPSANRISSLPRARGHLRGTIAHMTSAHSTRGSHRIFLGMAAGVGKTYRMLLEGQASGRERPRRRDRLPRVARTRRRPRYLPATSRSSRGGASPTARRASRRWTFPRSSRARRSSA